MVSFLLRDQGTFSSSDLTWGLRFRGLAFRVREEMALWNSAEIGEELILIGSRAA